MLLYGRHAQNMALKIAKKDLWSVFKQKTYFKLISVAFFYVVNYNTFIHLLFLIE